MFRGPGHFEKRLCAALATCVPAPAPSLLDLLQTATRAPAGSRQLILITPRPETAREALSELAASQQRFDPQLVARLVILPCLRQQLSAWFIENGTLESQQNRVEDPAAATTVSTPRPETAA